MMVVVVLLLKLRKGQDWTQAWLEANAKIVTVDENLTHSMAEFAKFSTRSEGNLSLALN